MPLSGPIRIRALPGISKPSSTGPPLCSSPTTTRTSVKSCRPVWESPIAGISPPATAHFSTLCWTSGKNDLGGRPLDVRKNHAGKPIDRRDRERLPGRPSRGGCGGQIKRCRPTRPGPRGRAARPDARRGINSSLRRFWKNQPPFRAQAETLLSGPAPFRRYSYRAGRGLPKSPAFPFLSGNNASSARKVRNRRKARFEPHRQACAAFSPKIFVPIRTILAPSCSATG